MPSWMLLVLLAALGTAPGPVQPARILVLLPFNGYSHYIMFENLLKELAARGHEVTEISPFETEKPAKNYRWISLVGSTERIQGTFKPADHYFTRAHTNIQLVAELGDQMCQQVMSHPNMQNFLKSDEQFDVIINEVFASDCLLAVLHKFPAPLIGASTHALMPYAIERMGVPRELSYVPTVYTGAADKMSYLQRLCNFLAHWGDLVHYSYKEAERGSWMRKHVGEDMPALSEIAANTSLILVNSHYSVFSPRPLVPGIVEVGGIHLKEPKPLPENLQKYLDNSPHGVVYFSMGSILRGASLSNETVRALVTVFSKLKENVLWKWEGETPPTGLSKNVLVQSWTPQGSLLAHPKLRVFISHGGLMGTSESVNAGVPMVVVPMFGDQHHNAAMLVNRGMAVKVDFPDLDDPDVVHAAIRKVLDDASFQENAKRTSAAFRDRPMSPLNTAVWWIEYVIRHRGAYFMQTQATKMPMWQRENLDVILTVLCAPLALVAALLACCCGKRTADKRKKE